MGPHTHSGHYRCFTVQGACHSTYLEQGGFLLHEDGRQPDSGSEELLRLVETNSYVLMYSLL